MIALLFGLTLEGQAATRSPQLSPPGTNSAPLGKPPIQEIQPGIFQIGEVQLDKNRRTASFAGSVNMNAGVVEYALVGSRGKLHESVLVTKAEPYHVHLAMLLLGATNRTTSVESGRPLTGHPIHISVTWKSGEEERQSRLEELIFKGKSREPMTRGVWIYNGSRVVEGTFLAQRDESIIAIIDDPDALMNNPRKDRENDEMWNVNEKAAPLLGAPVRITIELKGRSE